MTIINELFDDHEVVMVPEATDFPPVGLEGRVLDWSVAAFVIMPC
jgi:hypothetical protein